MKKIVLLAAAALFAAACADSTSPSAPRQVAPSNEANRDLICASGYVVAFDENGDPYCAPESDDGTGGRPGQRSRPRL